MRLRGDCKRRWAIPHSLRLKRNPSLLQESRYHHRSVPEFCRAGLQNERTNTSKTAPRLLLLWVPERDRLPGGDSRRISARAISAQADAEFLHRYSSGGPSLRADARSRTGATETAD